MGVLFEPVLAGAIPDYTHSPEVVFFITWAAGGWETLKVKMKKVRAES